MTSLAERKQNGAYYTDEAVARFLVSWAFRRAETAVLDPSCGDGVFLREALRYRPDARVVGVDISPEAVACARQGLAETAAEVIAQDFFSVTPGTLGRFDAVVGNPPFVRFHRFAGTARARALAAAQTAGVHLSGLSSAWAPFLVHAASFVKPGGRLAMVAPAELLHAAYARPVLRHLCHSFRHVVIITFERRLFTGLSQDTVLVLCDDSGSRFAQLRILNLADQWQLESLLDVDPEFSAGRTMDVEPVLSGEERALTYLLSPRTRELYLRLRDSEQVTMLGEQIAVSIGYVTGNNAFFHLSQDEAAARGLPPRHLRPVVRRADELRGLAYTEGDWETSPQANAKRYLLDLPADLPDLPAPVRAYLAEGERQGVPRAYKCRMRDPWYTVPGVYTPDVLLTYMIHTNPRLVLNQTAAAAPNSLLVGMVRKRSVSPRYLALAMMTSLSLLSAELEGHSLGGGLLKLEPREASRVRVPVVNGADLRRIERFFPRLDASVRRGEWIGVQQEVDRAILHGALGLTARDCDLLRRGWVSLQQRRLNR